MVDFYISSLWSPSNETIRRKPSPNGDKYEWIVLANTLTQAIAEWKFRDTFEEIDLIDVEYKVTLPFYNNIIQVIILNILQELSGKLYCIAIVFLSN